MNELVADKTMAIDPYSVDEIKRKLEEVLTSKQVYDRQVSNAKRKRHQFTWKKCAVDTSKILRVSKDM